MKKYIGTNVIKAKSMTLGEYNAYRGWATPKDEKTSNEGYLVEYEVNGISDRFNNHKDHNGYISWSPKELFKEDYKQSGELSFGGAIEMARRGFKVTRTGWNGAGLFAYICPEREDSIVLPGDDIEKTVRYREHWILKTAQGDLAAWSPSGSDSLGNDWCVVD